jgi:4-aminobutyrate aminotransferase
MSDSLKRDAEYLSPALGRAYDLVVVKAAGSFVYGEDGKKFLDMTSGIAVNQVGHSHPEVVKAIADQAASCIHTSCVVHYPANIDLAEKIAQISPGDLTSTFFCNSGAEAVDGAIKLAKRLKPGRNNFIAFKGAFHGRSLGATALTSSKSAYRKFYDPLLTGIHHLGFPNVYEVSTKESRDKLVDHYKKVFKSYFDTAVHPESVAAIIVEPMQGEGGYIPAPGLDGTQNYLKFLREFCDQHGILLIFDEVQSGIARTGKWFASEHYGVVPDILLMAKGLSGGLPLGAFTSRKELMQQMPPGSHGSTFGGNPVSCRAALKLLEIIERDKVMDNVKARSEQVFKFFESKFPGSDTRKTAAEHNKKIRVRGIGLMLALVLENAEAVNKVKAHGYSKGVLLLGCGTYGNIIRLAPDLTISEANLQQALDVIAEAIA